MAQSKTSYLTFKSVGGSQYVLLSGIGFASPTISLEFRVKSGEQYGNWNEYTFALSGSDVNGAKINLNNNDSVQFRAITDNAKFSESTTKYYQFTFNTSGGNIEASGSISSLLSHDASNVELPDYAFCYLFNGASKLTKAPDLPATNLGSFCYYRMFGSCRALTVAPNLPAMETKNGCYQYMFYYCTNLVKAPKLPALKLSTYCYTQMFQNCSSLTTAPALPATKMANYCYGYMFSECSSLTTTPALPAKELDKNCYSNMFSNCSKLKDAPLLIATTMTENCYNAMFKNCTSLVSAPELPATTLVKDCYRTMFNNCSSLKKIVVQFSNWTDASGNECTTSWVDGVPESGNFICPEGLNTDTYGLSRVPKDATHKWNVTKQ